MTTIPFNSRMAFISGTLWIDLGDVLTTHQYYGFGGDGNINLDGNVVSADIEGPVTDPDTGYATYTLTRDIYPKDLNMDSNVWLRTNGYRVIGTGDHDFTIRGLISNDGFSAYAGSGNGRLGAPKGTVPGGIDGSTALSGLNAESMKFGIYNVTASGGNAGPTNGPTVLGTSGSTYASYMSQSQYDDWLASPSRLLKALVSTTVDSENLIFEIQPQCGGGGGSNNAVPGGGGAGCVVIAARSIQIPNASPGVIRANGGVGYPPDWPGHGGSGGGGGGLVIVVTRHGVTGTMGSSIEALGGTIDNTYGATNGSPGLVIQAITG